MKPMTKALIVAAIHVAVVCSLGAKLLYDRSTRPRAWFKTERYDPNLPIRGRYVSLQIEVNDSRTAEEIQQKFSSEIATREQQAVQFHVSPLSTFGRECGSIEVNGESTKAVFDPADRPWNCQNLAFSRRGLATASSLQLDQPLLFFIPDTAKDPTRLATGEELWVLATVPRKGPPRPIALGVKKNSDASIAPLNLN